MISVNSWPRSGGLESNMIFAKVCRGVLSGSGRSARCIATQGVPMIHCVPQSLDYCMHGGMANSWDVVT